MTWIRTHRALTGAGALLVVGLVAWLAFGYFGVQTLFVDDEVDEALPTFASGANAPGGDAPGDDADGTDPADGPDADAAPGTTAEGEEEPAAADPGPTAAPEVATVAEGTFVGRSHPAAGRATVLTDGTQSFLRFEEFSTDNGPDLFVYLSRGTSADSPEDAFDDDFVDLGTLKGNIGDQNYELPADIDVAEYPTVVIWCRRFGVAFGAADLVPTP